MKKEERVDDEVEASPCKRIAIDASLVRDAFKLQGLAMTAAGIPQLKRSDTQYLTPGASDTDGTIEEESRSTSDRGTGETRIGFALDEALDVARFARAIEKVLPVLRKFVPLLKSEHDDKENYYRMCACGCGEGVSREDFEEAGCGYCGDGGCDNECEEQYCSNCGKKDCGAVLDGGFPGDESCILSS